MKKVFNSIFVTSILPTLLLTGCWPATKNSDNTLGVLAHHLPADIAQNIAGDRVQVDCCSFWHRPHAYQAAPSDVAKISESIC